MIDTPMCLRGVRVSITLMTDLYLITKYPDKEYYCSIPAFTDTELQFFTSFLGQSVSGTIPFTEIKEAIKKAF